MNRRSHDQNIKIARFKVEALDEQLQFLKKAKTDLEEKLSELQIAVPDNDISVNAQRDGYVAYGSYAQSISRRKSNIARSLSEIDNQISILKKDFDDAVLQLNKAERLKDRQFEKSDEISQAS